MDNTYISIGKFGKGVYAKKNIYKETLIFIDNVLVLSAEDTKKIQNTRLKFYGYTYNKEQDLICLGQGSFFNHSEDPNVTFKVGHLTLDPAIEIITFKAAKDIKEGEQLFINYRADGDVNLDEYFKN